MGTHLFGSPCI